MTHECTTIPCGTCGSGSDDNPANFDRPSYIDEVEMLVDSFRYELCSNCLKDLDRHIISPDPLGHAHLWCMDEEGE